jgi:hypothetical protein
VLWYEYELPELGSGAVYWDILHFDDHWPGSWSAAAPGQRLVITRVPGAVAHLPPVSVLFAAFLGYSPTQQLLKPQVLHGISSPQAVLLGHSFFPQLISKSFSSGLHKAFLFAIIAGPIAAAVS